MCVCGCLRTTGIWFPCVDVLWLCEPPDAGVNNWTWSSWRQLLSCLSSLLSLFFNLPENVHVDAYGGHRATSGMSPCFPPPSESFTAEYGRLSGSWASGKFSCLCLPSCCRNTGNIYYHAWLYLGAGIQTRVLMIVCHVLYPQNHLSSPTSAFNLFILHAHEEQLEGVNLLLSLCGSWESDSGHWAWRKLILLKQWVTAAKDLYLM